MQKTNILLTIILCATFLLFANKSFSQVYCRIEVIDYDTKEAIPDVSVRVVGLFNGDVDKNGNVSFRINENETYRIIVTREGYRPYYGLIKARPNEVPYYLIELVEAASNSFFLRGRIIDNRGTNIPNKKITIQIGNFRRTILTDSIIGDFHIEIPLKESNGAIEGTIGIDFEDCPPTLYKTFRSLPAGQYSEIIEIKKECFRKIQGVLRSTKGRFIRNANLYYQQTSTPNAPMKVVEVENGIFLIDSLLAEENVNIFFEHHQYHKIQTSIPVYTDQSKNHSTYLEPKRLFLPKINVKNNNLFVASSAISLSGIVVGTINFCKASRIHKDYIATMDNEAFLNEWPIFQNRDEAYTKIESLRKSSAAFLISGIVVGAFGIVALRKSNSTRIIDFKINPDAIGFTYNFK